MKSPFLSLLKAQRDRIVEETGFAVYDDFPGREVSLPYVVIGEVESRAWSDKFQAGHEVRSTLHVWSDYPGRKEIAEMIDVIIRSLSREPLYLGPEFSAVYAGLELMQIIIDIDGLTRHGIIEFRYLIEEV